MTKERYPHLFQPFDLGRGFVARNRIQVAPMTVGYFDHDGFVTRHVLEHYGRRAQGGAGVVITEELQINYDSRQLPHNGMFFGADRLPGFKRLSAEIRKHGAIPMAQICHAGRYSGPWEEYNRRRRLAPSAVPFEVPGLGELTPDEITRDEIKGALVDFEKVGAYAHEAGFDGVEVHGGSGFLVSEFLSPWMNRREDEWGGSFENRTRFALEVARALRRGAGDDFLIGWHIMMDELRPNGISWSREETLVHAPQLVEAGVDFFRPMMGTFDTNRMPENQGRPRERGLVSECIAVKKAAPGARVMGGNNLNDATFSEGVLARGEMDGVSIARGILADPDWCNKVLEGREEEIVGCACTPNVCIQHQKTGVICSAWPDEAKKTGYYGY